MNETKKMYTWRKRREKIKKLINEKYKKKRKEAQTKEQYTRIKRMEKERIKNVLNKKKKRKPLREESEERKKEIKGKMKKNKERKNCCQCERKKQME